jgi:hypothetical protein
MVQRDGQHRQPERIRQQDELLPLAVALLAGSGQELDAAHPLGFSQLHLAREIVQVRTNAVMTSFRRGSGQSAMLASTAGVMVCSSMFRMVPAPSG